MLPGRLKLVTIDASGKNESIVFPSSISDIATTEPKNKDDEITKSLFLLS